MRRLVLLVLSIAVLAACGAGSSSPEKAETTRPPRVYTLDELKTALPTKEQVPTAVKGTTTCPGERYCDKGTVSLEFELRPPGEAQDVERLAKKAFVSDYSSVGARNKQDATAATALVKKTRKSMAKYDGPFNIKLKSNGEKSFVPGEKGTGRITDISVQGWRGFSVSRVQQFSGYADDGSKSVEFNSTKYEITYLMIYDNRAVLTAYVAVAAEPRTKGASSTIAHLLAKDYVKRLG